MQLKEINYGVKSIGNITIFKMRFAMRTEDAKLIADMLPSFGYNVGTSCKLSTTKRMWWTEHAILTVGGAVNSAQYCEIIELLHTAAHKYQKEMLDLKFYANKK